MQVYSAKEIIKLLSNTLIADSEGTEQWTGGLKSTLVKNMSMYSTEDDLYKNSWKAIAAEIQLFGGDTVVNLVRGKGVVYREENSTGISSIAGRHGHRQG
mgnify:FL=1